MQTWMDWFPERYASELAAYADNSIPIVIDEDSRARGTLHLTAEFSSGGSTYPIKVTYPSLFPYFAPSAYLEDHQFDRHQHPAGGNLCLLGRGTKQWDSEDHFAQVLRERFPIILEINQSQDETYIKSLEEPQGEPFSEYFNSIGLKDSLILFDGSITVLPEIRLGTAKLRMEVTSSDSRRPSALRGYVAELKNKGEAISVWKGPKIPRFHREVSLPWVRLDNRPKGVSSALLDQLTDDQKRHVGILPLTRKSVTFLFVFEEEVEQFRFAQSLGCITLHPSIGNDRKGRPTSHRVYHQKTFRFGDAEINARMPSVATLSEKTVAIFGLGAIGSPVALELARAGIGKLKLVDFDIVEPATIKRWAIGFEALGKQKVEALSKHIGDEYPWTVAHGVELKIGEVPAPGQSDNQFGEICDLIGGADLVIDATAETGVNEFLSVMARQLNVPYIVGSATAGAWGGYVARFQQKEKEPCWACLMHDFYAGDWAKDLPPADPQGQVQPPGCATVTFTGLAVDLKEVSLEIVRSSFGILTSTYPVPNEQLSILMNMDDRGRSNPIWRVRGIAKREACECQT